MTSEEHRVYLAWLTNCWYYNPELVGVFGSKASAYKAVRKRLYEEIEEHQRSLPVKEARNDYDFVWRIQAVNVVP